MNPLIAVISIAAMAIPSLLPSLFTKVLGTAQETVIKSTTSYNETVADLLTGYEVNGGAMQRMRCFINFLRQQND